MPVSSGILTFDDENEKSVSFSTPLASAVYNVQVTADSFVSLRVTSQTVNGFTVQASSNFTGQAGYDVFQ